MTSGSSPHWLAAPLQTANPNAKIHWRGRAGLSQQPTSSCFLLGVQKDLYFWSCYKGFNYNTYFCQVAIDTFIFWIFFPSLLTSRNEVNLARIEKPFLTSLPAYFFYIYSSILCPVPNWHGVQTCVCLTGWSGLRFCLEGPVSPSQQSESNGHVLSVVVLA